ncbi:MAG TPA: ABC transporter ATP-binding protein [Caulobacteraceae bacterium]|nr:ABC transporter ATP-binding protein [Caulobacteraceae bacterium]
MNEAPLVRFENVVKRFGGTAAVDGVSLDIAAGEFFALLGPSGCGKTTLMRLLAGFETPHEGRVMLAGEDLTDTPPHRRALNMMFQSYALFPHLSVAQNVAFGLKMEGLGKAEIAARVEEMLTLVRLEGLGGRRPDQLSGGQKQRVALARALAKRPKVLLLDEPLAALDRKLREETRFELKALQQRLGAAFVIVTHDQDEAMALSDRMAVMDGGRIVQVGTPREVYERPVSRWAAGFIGDVNLFEAAEVTGWTGRQPWVGVRPETMWIAKAARAGAGFDGVVAETGFLGERTSYLVALADGRTVRISMPNSGGGPFERGQRVSVGFDPAQAFGLDA